MAEDAVRQKYRGCLLGSAVGDALGAPVEFMRREEIRRRFGDGGIRDYVPGAFGLGRITDDTQMTLATARGLLEAALGVRAGEIEAVLSSVHRAYLDWLKSQDDPGMRRSPGFTCISALKTGRMGTVEQPLNDSKGCGGVMRVSPVGLAFPGMPDLALEVGIKTAAITHGHPGGYVPAGFLAALISRLIIGERLGEAVLGELDRGYPDPVTVELVRKSVELAQSGCTSGEAITMLGEGWTGDEALAIGIYCALRHEGSFEEGILAAVNHSGDSDSTGAISGAILGAWLGKKAIPPRWLDPLESKGDIESVADQLFGAFHGGQAQPKEAGRYG